MKIYSKEDIEEKINKRIKRKKILRFFTYPIIIFIIACALSIVMQKVVYRKDYVELFGYKSFTIASGSMMPTLEIGDVIISKKVAEKDLKEGDIITFLEGEGNVYNVTHRIKDIVKEDGKTLYRTKGDNNNTNDDELVKYENIVGKYQFKISKIGNWVVQIQTTCGIVVAILVIYLIYDMSSRKEERELSREKIRGKYDRKEARRIKREEQEKNIEDSFKKLKKNNK